MLCLRLFPLIAMSSHLLLTRAFTRLAPRARHLAPALSRGQVRSFHYSSPLFASVEPTQQTQSATVDYFSISDSDGAIQFGDYSPLTSQTEIDRKYVKVKDLGNASPAVGDTVWLRGRVSSVRAKGNACFMVVRGGSFYTVQALHFKDKADPDRSKGLIKFVGSLPLESIVDIQGVVAAADVKSCTQSGVEIQIQKIFTVARAPVTLPFLLEDAARSDREIEESQGSDRPFAGVSQAPANNAIMRVRGGVSLLFREALTQQGFTEINTPKLTVESEGGSEVFRTDYFGTPACLAQSPQLYKQMAISADLERVFEIGPVFRAEKSFTRRHLCEFTGLDLEMSIQFHYNEALEVIHHMFRHIFTGLEERYAEELKIIRLQYPSEPVTFTDKPLTIHWPQGMAMLKEAGHEVDELGDLTGAHELALGGLVKAQYGADFFALDQYPVGIRPFYTMPSQSNPLLSNSYDLFIRGQEICSGAQRCHIPDLLEQRIVEKGLELAPLQSYVDSFRHAVSPHAGAGIGLERVVFLYLGLDNVRKASMFPRDPNRCSP
ncbi:aspartate-tRNA ligase [Ochromonadaceae sp. CCMP2298]|nr:aspartate-tRNA ligase [Ochromonadaceae sp. CCMP2298]